MVDVFYARSTLPASLHPNLMQGITRDDYHRCKYNGTSFNLDCQGPTIIVPIAETALLQCLRYQHNNFIGAMFMRFPLFKESITEVGLYMKVSLNLSKR